MSYENIKKLNNKFNNVYNYKNVQATSMENLLAQWLNYKIFNK
jgi:hypothetical protein